jgi:hypothetical protein
MISLIYPLLRRKALRTRVEMTGFGKVCVSSGMEQKLYSQRSAEELYDEAYATTKNQKTFFLFLKISSCSDTTMKQLSTQSGTKLNLFTVLFKLIR